MKIIPLNSWITKGNEPLLIAGPCGAESREQVLATAKALSEIKGIQLFRAGIWKPRTRPNSFEGVGEKGLEWLNEVKEKYNLKTTVEVANAHHAELAQHHLNVGIPDATAKAIMDGWYLTGDYGYLSNGELFVSGSPSRESPSRPAASASTTVGAASRTSSCNRSRG